MDEITFTIDGNRLSVPIGTTILKAALENGIYIPHLCYHPDLEPAGYCRLCMVEVEGGGIVTSCNTSVREGMVIRTEGEDVERVRRTAVELLVLNHPLDCLLCEKNTNCELQKVARFIGIDEERLARMRKSPGDFNVDDSNPFFIYDPKRCVLCSICIRACREIPGIGNLDFAFRGFNTIVSTFAGKSMIESRCVSCGECVVRCPVGALKPKNISIPSRSVKTICPYCGVGCGIYLNIRGNRVVGAEGDRSNPVNRGRLCVKGRYGHEFINHPERLKTPLIKKNGEFVSITWDEALSLIVEKLSKYHGDEFAGISSAKCTNEENYLFQKFTRAVMGTNNIDHCARLCHAPTVAGLAQSLGSGAMTNSINEIPDTNCLLAIGTNTTEAHPVISYYMKEAVRRGAKLIVINPRRIDLCEYANIFLQNVPGTDVALLMGMCRIILEENLQDDGFIKNRCENFDEFRKSLEAFDHGSVEKITGIPFAQIREAARIYATIKPGMILYAMGITQHTHGTDNVLAISNLALLTGNIGKPSSGINPLRGQNNVQGACDMGALPNVFPGYQRVDVPVVREKFEKAWGYKLPSNPGLTHVEIFDAIINGNIKVLYQIGENPALSEANAGHAIEAIKKLEFFIVQDIFLTETARHAHIVLPATSFAEKDGTFTNTERCVQMIRKAIEPVGSSKPDWLIICEIAKKMGKRGFDFSHPSQIMEEIASLTPSYAGINYNRLEDGGIQWPCPSEDSGGTPVLHTEFFATPSGKGKFFPLTYRPSFELPDEEYPFILTTERSLYHFHTATMTRKGGLNILKKREEMAINSEDAERLGLEDGDAVRIVSRRGSIESAIKITDRTPRGVVAMTFHFAETPTNMVTSSALDPVSKIPETKVCAVRIEKLK
ncbi:MAG: formate dehydrogenase subunit alpha [Spirochaetota bacterium]